MKDRIVIGISGASGAAISVRLVELLAGIASCETHLVVTAGGERTLRHEVGADALGRLDGLVTCRHPVDDVGASIASGSFRTLGMIVAPCSMHTLSAIAAGVADNLLLRAANVHLKERRRLVLLARESPLHLGHIRAMATVTEYGAIVAPPVPPFYLAPGSIEEVIDHLARRALELAGIDIGSRVEWAGLADD